MKRQEFITNKKKGKNIKEPEFKANQLWSSIEENDFGNGSPTKYTLLLLFRSPATKNWVCQINNYKTDMAMVLTAMSRIEISDEMLKKDFEYFRDYKPQQAGFPYINAPNADGTGGLNGDVWITTNNNTSSSISNIPYNQMIGDISETISLQEDTL